MPGTPKDVRVVDDGARYLKELSRQKRRPNYLKNGLPEARVESFSREEKLAALGILDSD